MEDADILETGIGKQNVGNAGEYYIASRLSAENFITTITLGRAEKYDILAVNPAGKTIKLSVKTRYKKTDRFILSIKDEGGGSDDFYYVFIRLNEFTIMPEFWIIPSKRVNEILARQTKDYMSKVNRDGGERKDTGIRNLWLKLGTQYTNTYPADWLEELKKYEGNKGIEQLKS